MTTRSLFLAQLLATACPCRSSRLARLSPMTGNRPDQMMAPISMSFRRACARLVFTTCGLALSLIFPTVDL